MCENAWVSGINAHSVINPATTNGAPGKYIPDPDGRSVIPAILYGVAGDEKIANICVISGGPMTIERLATADIAP